MFLSFQHFLDQSWLQWARVHYQPSYQNYDLGWRQTNEMHKNCYPMQLWLTWKSSSSIQSRSVIFWAMAAKLSFEKSPNWTLNASRSGPWFPWAFALMLKTDSTKVSWERMESTMALDRGAFRTTLWKFDTVTVKDLELIWQLNVLGQSFRSKKFQLCSRHTFIFKLNLKRIRGKQIYLFDFWFLCLAYLPGR